jgi:hypothetical protein
MQPTFLCNKHANWVYQHPDIALQYIATNELKGELLAASGMYKQAISFYGCAFDIAAIVNEIDTLNEAKSTRLGQKLSMVALALYRLYDLANTREFQKGILERAFVKLYPREESALDFLSEVDLLEVMQTESFLLLRPTACLDNIH